MIYPKLVAALDAARQNHAALAGFRPNDPDREIPAEITRIMAVTGGVLKEITPEIAIELGQLYSAVQDLNLSQDDDFHRLELLWLRYKNSLDTARREAIAAGFAPYEQDQGNIPSGMVPRASLEKELAPFIEALADLRQDVADLRDRNEQDRAAPEEQKAFIQFTVEKMNVKLSLIDLKIGTLIDIPGLNAATKAALRLARAFVNTVRSATARVNDWVKTHAVRKLLPHVDALAKRVLEVIEKAQTQKPAAAAASATPPLLPSALPPLARFQEAFLDGSGKAPLMIRLPRGQYWRGSPETDAEAFDDEKPRMLTTIAHDVALARAPVTRREWAAFVAATDRPLETGIHKWNAAKEEWLEDKKGDWRDPGFAQTDDHPVVGVSFADAEDYCRWLSEKTGADYRLPSEGEWEFACRADAEAREDAPRYPWGDAWDAAKANGAQAHGGTTAVGQFGENAWGFVDLNGNAWEWCSDIWTDQAKDWPTDGTAFRQKAKGNNSSQRAVRGGSWNYNPRLLRTAYRNHFDARNRIVDHGFRVSRTL